LAAVRALLEDRTNAFEQRRAERDTANAAFGFGLFRRRISARISSVIMVHGGTWRRLKAIFEQGNGVSNTDHSE
jgi:hypothetical protein